MLCLFLDLWVLIVFIFKYFHLVHKLLTVASSGLKGFRNLRLDDILIVKGVDLESEGHSRSLFVLGLQLDGPVELLYDHVADD